MEPDCMHVILMHIEKAKGILNPYILSYLEFSLTWRRNFMYIYYVNTNIIYNCTCMFTTKT